MKTRPLPETDLATIAPLPVEDKRRALQSFRLGIPPYSYTPCRSSFADILNLEAGMLGELPMPPWPSVMGVIQQKSKSRVEEEANIRVAAGLYEYAAQMGLRGRKDEFRPMPTRVGENLVYWTPAVLIVNERPLIPFFHPRRTRLSRLARRFIFSMINERIRVDNPDYRDVALGIYEFEANDAGPRRPALQVDEGIELFSYEQLDAMVGETYAIWREVCEARAQETRRRPTGTGPLL